MATALLTVIYISFIGLGIPDSLFGSAWPAVYSDFNVPLSVGGLVTLIISACTTVSSLLSARVINRFGTGKVTAVSTVLTAVALLGFSLSGNLYFFLIFALPLGLGAGAVDTALNNYVALHYSASHMSFLHCFYGIGVFVSPYIMSEILKETGNWHIGYRIMFAVQLVISVIAFSSLPLWKNFESSSDTEDKPKAEKVLSIAEMCKNPSIRLVWLIFMCSCAIEGTTGSWCSTYLVNEKNIPVDAAALVTAVYYGGLALGRLSSGFLSKKLSATKIVCLSLTVLILSVIFLFLPPIPFTVFGIFCTGFGIGPVFPNLMHLMPIRFGSDISQSVIGSQLAASYISIMAVPPLFGILGQYLGMGILPIFIGVVALLLSVAFFRFKSQWKAVSQPETENEKVLY